MRWVTPRHLALLLVLTALVQFWPQISEPVRRRYLAWRYPPQALAPGENADIVKDLDRRASLELRGRHRRLKAKLAAARAKGLDTGQLDLAADAVLALDNKDMRRLAHRKLEELEMLVPREKTRYIPMYEPLEEEIAPDAAGARAKSQRPKAKKKKRGRSS